MLPSSKTLKTNKHTKVHNYVLTHIYIQDAEIRAFLSFKADEIYFAAFLIILVCLDKTCLKLDNYIKNTNRQYVLHRSVWSFVSEAPTSRDYAIVTVFIESYQEEELSRQIYSAGSI